MTQKCVPTPMSLVDFPLRIHGLPCCKKSSNFGDFLFTFCHFLGDFFDEKGQNILLCVCLEFFKHFFDFPPETKVFYIVDL